MVWASAWGLSLEEDTKRECWESSRGRDNGEGPPPGRPQLGSMTRGQLNGLPPPFLQDMRSIKGRNPGAPSRCLQRFQSCTAEPVPTPHSSTMAHSFRVPYFRHPAAWLGKTVLIHATAQMNIEGIVRKEIRQTHIQTLTRVCVYERPGVDKSASKM